MSTRVHLSTSPHVTRFTETLDRLSNSIPAAARPKQDAFYDELSSAIRESCDYCRDVEAAVNGDSEALDQQRAAFREQILPWFDQSWFMHRARTKPRGYPGDYCLLTAIYDQQSKATGFGGYLDLYFLNTQLARAVRGRLQSLREFLRKEFEVRSEASLLNVACGPLREAVEGIVEPGKSRVSLTCLDYDDEALEYVRTNVVPQTPLNVDVDCVKYNALRTKSAGTNIERFGRPDIIYSVGLCDYIPDKHLIPMLQGWRETVGDAGAVYVAFKDCREYDCTEYQWHVDWHFYQRTEDECTKLFRDAGYDSLDMSRDASGTIINYVGRMPAADSAAPRQRHAARIA